MGSVNLGRQVAFWEIPAKVLTCTCAGSGGTVCLALFPLDDQVSGSLVAGVSVFEG